MYKQHEQRRTADNTQQRVSFPDLEDILPKIRSRELKQIPGINGLGVERIGGNYKRMSNIGEEEIFAELNEMVGLAGAGVCWRVYRRWRVV
jgi:hypothetical protein